MEQMRQNEAGALTAQAIPQKDVEQACFHALGLIGRNCEYLSIKKRSSDEPCAPPASTNTRKTPSRNLNSFRSLLAINSL